MMRPLLAVLVIVAVAVWPSSQAAAATQSTISDTEKLFSSAAREKALARLSRLEEETRYPVFIETVAFGEADSNPLLRLWKSRQVSRALVVEANKRAEAAGVAGLYILINANPHAVAVVAWPRIEDSPFNTRDCDLLRRQVSRHLSWDGPDAALQTATDTLREQYDEHHPRETFTHSTTFAFGLIVLALALLGLLLSVMSRRLGPGSRRAILTQTPSFKPALLAAQLGLPGAFWIYDRFFLVAAALLPPGDPPESLFATLPIPIPETTSEDEQHEQPSSLGPL